LSGRPPATPTQHSPGVEPSAASLVSRSGCPDCWPGLLGLSELGSGRVWNARRQKTPTRPCRRRPCPADRRSIFGQAQTQGLRSHAATGRASLFYPGLYPATGVHRLTRRGFYRDRQFGPDPCNPETRFPASESIDYQHRALPKSAVSANPFNAVRARGAVLPPLVSSCVFG
jgi:hypothetical protein